MLPRICINLLEMATNGPVAEWQLAGLWSKTSVARPTVIAAGACSPNRRRPFACLDPTDLLLALICRVQARAISVDTIGAAEEIADQFGRRLRSTRGEHKVSVAGGGGAITQASGFEGGEDVGRDDL